VATAPVQPPPPAPHTGGTFSSGPVDLTKNSLYNAMIKLGYNLEKRESFGGATVVMRATAAVVDKLGGVGSLHSVNSKIAYFHINGYDLIRFDTSNAGETDRITGLLRDFFAPYPI
jgi:hypothetical protein